MELVRIGKLQDKKNTYQCTFKGKTKIMSFELTGEFKENEFTIKLNADVKKFIKEDEEETEPEIKTSKVKAEDQRRQEVNTEIEKMFNTAKEEIQIAKDKAEKEIEEMKIKASEEMKLKKEILLKYEISFEKLNQLFSEQEPNKSILIEYIKSENKDIKALSQKYKLAQNQIKELLAL